MHARMRERLMVISGEQCVCVNDINREHKCIKGRRDETVGQNKKKTPQESEVDRYDVISPCREMS